MSANAFKILEVSGAADEPLAGAGWPPRGLKPGAGDPSGVVDSTSVQDMLDLRERERERERRRSQKGNLTWRCGQLLSEGREHGCGEGLAAFPDINELLDLLLEVKTIRERYDPLERNIRTKRTK
jgi:hypothetical protein